MLACNLHGMEGDPHKYPWGTSKNNVWHTPSRVPHPYGATLFGFRRQVGTNSPVLRVVDRPILGSEGANLWGFYPNFPYCWC